MSAAGILTQLAAIPRDRAEHHGRRGRCEAARQRRSQRAERATDRAAERGLVKQPYLSVFRGARLVQLYLPGDAIAPKGRGECEGFSARSRKRLLELMHKVRRDAALPVMVTLTFPAEAVVTPAEAKACRLAWAKRVKRVHPEWCSVWRLEAHPELSRKLGRMHPHLHLLTWGARYDFAWVSRTWTEVVWEVLSLDAHLREWVSGALGELVREKHMAAGTSCERVRKWAGVAYCAKSYIAKAEEYPVGKVGRVWGYDYARHLPVVRGVEEPLTNREAYAVVSRVWQWMSERHIQSEFIVTTFFCDNPEALARWLLGDSSSPAPT